MKDELKELFESMRRLIEEAKDAVEEDEVEESSEGLEKIQEIYRDFMVWCFGEMRNLTYAQAISAWKRLHPDLQFPEVLKYSNMIPSSVAICLLIEVYPLYLKCKSH